MLLELVPQFQKESGHTVVIDNDTAGSVAPRIEGGEAVDLVVNTPKRPDAAQALIKLLTGSSADSVLKARGMERPPS